MMKKELPVRDAEFSPAEKERLIKKFFEKEQKQIKLGKRFAVLTLIALIFTAVTTSLCYQFFAADLIERAFVKPPEDITSFDKFDNVAGFVIQMIIISVILIKTGLAIGSCVCIGRKKAMRPMLTVSAIIFAFIDLLFSVMQLTDPNTYQSGLTTLALFVDLIALALMAVSIYMTVFTDYVSKYEYDCNNTDISKETE